MTHRTYCTYFDVNYLPRGLALYESLRQQDEDFTLEVLCLDDDVRACLEERSLDGVRLTSLADLEDEEPELLATRDTRSRVEYIFTAGPSFLRYVFNQNPEVDLLTYLDSDLYFFASPELLFEEIQRAGASTAIVGHRFPERLRHLEEHGRYNVAWVSFRRDEDGLACLEFWRAACLEWCYDRVEDGRYADQRYLDEFPRRFARVHELRHPGADVAPWNLGEAQLRMEGGRFVVPDEPLVFFHFQGLRQLSRSVVDPNLAQYGRRVDRPTRRLYLHYVAALGRAEAGLASVSPRRAAHANRFRSWASLVRGLATRCLLWTGGTDRPPRHLRHAGGATSAA